MNTNSNPDESTAPAVDVTDAAAVPPPSVRQRRAWRVSLVWLVPLLAVLLGLSVALRAWSRQGPEIEISFKTADGLEAGKTQLRFKNVVIGSVREIRLSADRTHVITRVALDNDARAFATENTRFWVVRPRIGARGVSGIDTLLSGAFIEADAGDAKTPQKAFVGLEAPPPVRQGEAGRQFQLSADDLGSLDIGSPVYYRRIQVGQVVAVKLADAGRSIGLSVFINAPHDQLVSKATRFWNASGLNVALGADGLKLRTQSLSTILAGGIAFQDPPHAEDKTPATADTRFRLAADQAAAMAQIDGEAIYVTMRFKQSLRGLSVNAPVEFQGVELGQVLSLDLDFDARKQAFSTVVGALLYPQRMGQAYQRMLPDMDAAGLGHEGLLAAMVGKGLRAVPRTGNLLSGQLYVALDFVPNAAKVSFDPQASPVEIPTERGKFDKLQDQAAAIVERLDKIPFDSIGRRLDGNLASLDQTLRRVNGETLPALQGTLAGATRTLGDASRTLSSADKALGSADGALNEDSALRRELATTLEELQRSARSLRELTDYLGRHPESLIRGRQAAPAQKPKPP